MIKISNNRTADRIFIISCYIGILGLFFGFANIYIWLVLLAIKLLSFNRVEFGFFSLILGSGLFGRLFASDLLMLSTTTLFILLGIITLRREILKVFKYHTESYLFLAAIYIVCILFYLLGTQSEYANEKMIKMIVRGSIWLTAFLIYGQTVKLSNAKISIATLLVAVFFISQAAQLYNVFPSSFTDVSFFRDKSYILYRDNDSVPVVNYHTMGYLSLMAFAFILSSDKFFNQNRINTILILLLCFILTIISGARQAVFIFAIMIVVRLMLYKGFKLSLGQILTAVIVGVFFLVIIKNSESSYITTVFTEETTADKFNRDVVTPFKVMDVNPLLGVGFGGYPEYANKTYPHNIFLEIICEMGVFGVLLFLIIMMGFLYKRRYFLSYIYLNGSLFLMFFIIYFLKVQVSGDLGSSIILFCVIFSCVKHKAVVRNNVFRLSVDNQCFKLISKR